MIAKTFGKRGAPSHFARAQGASPAAARPTQPNLSAALVENVSDAERLLAKIPIVTICLILGLIAVFSVECRYAFDMAAGHKISLESLIAFGAVSYDLVIGSNEFWRIFLGPLLHASTSHLTGNCLALLLVGLRLEPLIGRGWFAAIFGASALGGVAGSVFGNAHDLASVGASGAILGIVAALFAMSFHGGVDAVKQRLMRRRAFIFGVPALLPLFLGLKSQAVDYHAHFGGAIVGGAIGLALATLWSGESFRPSHARQAGRAALAILGLSMASCWFIGRQFQAEQAEARLIIPSSDLIGNPMDVARRAPELMAEYPSDPRGRFLLAVNDIKYKRLSQAEASLRILMVQKWPQRPSAERVQHVLAQALLASVLGQQGHMAEALALARVPCTQSAGLALRPLLVKAGLCSGSLKELRMRQNFKMELQRRLNRAKGGG